MSLVLVTDSTCDLDPKLLKEKGIRSVPLSVLFEDVEYIDKISISNAEFYKKMRDSANLPTTSQVNPNAFYEVFKEELIKDNEVIGVFLSSALSGTYRSACIAKEMLENEYENTDKIHIIDSKTVSFSLGLLVIMAKEKIDEGMKADELIEFIEMTATKSQLYGLLDTLENLKKGGRLSSGMAIIGKILHLKPIIEVNKGLVNVISKARGSKKGINWMLDQLEKDHPTLKIDFIAIAHSNDFDKLKSLKEELEAKFKIGRIFELEVGSVVGTHTGEGVVGIAYVKN